MTRANSISKEGSASKGEVLPSDVAELYSVREGLLQKFICQEFGEVDLTTVNLEFASRLADAGYLIKKTVQG